LEGRNDITFFEKKLRSFYNSITEQKRNWLFTLDPKE